ncbi:MAG: DUF3800 domain-containing protein [Nitrospinae bacterium]|nr:DUF3800 domain-containing protein [Nitrospinota bacterium]
MIQLDEAWKLLVLQYGNSVPVMALTSYLDDSGKYEDPGCKICCVGGCVSPEDAWKEFNTEWKAVLDQYGVPYLHMKEYAHSSGENFGSWKDDEEKRRTFLSALMDIIERKVMCVVGATVPIQAFDMLTPDQKRMVLDPFFMCTQEAFHGSSAAGWAWRQKIKVRFSNDSENSQRIKRCFDYIKTNSQIGEALEDFDMQDMRDNPPLQAADLVAYEVHYFAKTLIETGPGHLRTPMKRLFRENYYFTFFDYNSIVKRFYFSRPASRS